MPGAPGPLVPLWQPSPQNRWAFPERPGFAGTAELGVAGRRAGAAPRSALPQPDVQSVGPRLPWWIATHLPACQLWVLSVSPLGRLRPRQAPRFSLTALVPSSPGRPRLCLRRSCRKFSLARARVLRPPTGLWGSEAVGSSPCSLVEPGQAWGWRFAGHRAETRRSQAGCLVTEPDIGFRMNQT